MLLRAVFRLIYFCIHLLLSAYCFVAYLIDWMSELFMVYASNYNLARLQRECEVNKKLRHVSLVMAEDQVHITEIARLVCWCIAVRVQHVSIYDAKGVLKRKHSALEDAINQYRPVFFTNDAATNNITLQFHHGLRASSRWTVPAEKHTTDTDPQQFTITILSLEDCQQAVVDATRKLCEAVQEKKCTPDSVNYESLHYNLSGPASSFPDPDLMLKFDQYQAMNGFLPWHIRLTEIVEVGRLRGITCHQFVRALHRYANTTQRFGT
jgi:dehydrodolichyl diphosphate syntase complex subunit NUS1